jgi:hypothetical protein
MNNIERLAKHITKYGKESILIHTIPGTPNWIVCQYIGNDNWSLTLIQPLGNVTYNLGIVSNEQHLQLWKELVITEIKNKIKEIQLAKRLSASVSKKQEKIK